jgi:hypothetical protein
VDKNFVYLYLFSRCLGSGNVGNGRSHGNILTEKDNGAPEVRQRQRDRTDALGMDCTGHTDIVLVGGG